MVESDGMNAVFTRDSPAAIIQEYPAARGEYRGTEMHSIGYLGDYRAIGIGEPGDCQDIWTFVVY